MVIKLKSIWLDVETKEYKSLNENIECDILIIGGGISGILLAYMLKDSHKKVVLVEAKKIGSGVTTNTTAHVTSQHDLTYYRYSEIFGLYKMEKIYNANQDAIKGIKKIINDEKINCNFKDISSIAFANNQKTINEMIKEYDVLKKINAANISLLDKSNEKIKYKKALKSDNQAIFHPLQFINGVINSLDNNINIYENTRILHFKNNIAYTKNHEINAKQIVIATHNPIINFPGTYFTKMYMGKSHCFAFKSSIKINNLYNEIDNSKLTFRSYDDYIIASGKSIITARSCKEIYEDLKKDILNYFPDAQFITSWSAQDGITLDYLPYIGKYNKKNDSFYVITGFNKWGMTTSYIAANIIADELLDKKNEYSEIYSPQRKFSKKAIINFSLYNLSTIPLYLRKFFTYKDPICPHLKCRMKYNKEEKIYECPCHGSRFDLDFKIIDTPSIHDIVKK